MSVKFLEIKKHIKHIWVSIFLIVFAFYIFFREGMTNTWQDKDLR